MNVHVINALQLCIINITDFTVKSSNFKKHWTIKKKVIYIVLYNIYL